MRRTHRAMAAPITPAMPRAAGSSSRFQLSPRVDEASSSSAEDEAESSPPRARKESKRLAKLTGEDMSWFDDPDCDMGYY